MQDKPRTVMQISLRNLVLSLGCWLALPHNDAASGQTRDYEVPFHPARGEPDRAALPTACLARLGTEKFRHGDRI